MLGKKRTGLGHDLTFVGGGLASALTAYRLAALRPDLRIAVLERSGTLGGDHTWSFHATDVSPAAAEWLKPFIVAAWDAQEVRFPAHARELGVGYRMITSERLREVIAASPLADGVMTEAEVVEVCPQSVTLADGREMTSGAVIDARGWPRDADVRLGYQRFFGREVRLCKPHGQTRPVIMDAGVAQFDGYRFVYTLPLGRDRILIEDTYYADTPALDVETLSARIDAYAAAQGWTIAETFRTEQGVLPVVLDGALNGVWPKAHADIPRIGVRAGLFNHVTSYSLPDAVRMAERIAALDGFEPARLARITRGAAETRWQAQGFERFLNRLLFDAAEPEKRYRVLERFYRFSEGLVGRFYAGELTWADRARITIGRPPLPLARAAATLAAARW